MAADQRLSDLAGSILQTIAKTQRKSWRDAQDTEKSLELGMNRKLRTSKRSSWKPRGLVLKVQVNNWTWDRSAKFWNFDVQMVYVFLCIGTPKMVLFQGGGNCNTLVLTPFALKVHDVYIVINHGEELKAKIPTIDLVVLGFGNWDCFRWYIVLSDTL